MYADLVLVNGRVLTLDPDGQRATGVAVVGDRIRLVGDDASVRDAIGPGTQVVDLAGRPLLPGFNDAHCHVTAYGMALAQIDCGPDVIEHLDQILEAVREAAASEPPERWIRGRGYDDTRLPPRYGITRHDIDRVAPHHPVLLVRVCGHVATANTRALELAGITRETPDPAGGKIDRDAHGEPTGVLRESARNLVDDVIPEPTVEETEAYILRAAEHYVAAGITSVQDAGTLALNLRAYQNLYERGELPFRVYAMVQPEVMDALAQAGLHTGWGDDWLKIGPVKIMLDGGIGARTAAQTEPYAGEPDNRGILWMEQEELDDLVERSLCAGFQAATHAIGDRAIAAVLDAYQRGLERCPRPAPRLRVEHCSLPLHGLIDRLAALQVVVVTQPIFLEMADSYVKSLGHERAARTLPFRSLLDAGVILGGSSDSPVSPYSPLRGIQAAVTRNVWDGSVSGPDEAIGLEAALRMFTWGGAYAQFQEHRKGSIEPGKLADFAVLGRDPFEVAPGEIGAIPVTMTVIGGEIVYRRDL